MIRAITILAVALLSLNWFSAFGQTDLDRKLAYQYFQNGEFDKALIYYKKLYDDRPTKSNYSYQYQCYLKLSQLEEAEKLTKKHLKRRSSELWLYVNLGNIYQLLEKPKKASQYYEKGIKGIDQKSTFSQVKALGTKFKDDGLLDYALKTYLRAQKVLANHHAPYNTHVGEIYGLQGETEKMINQYIELLDVSDGYLITVQSLLNRAIDFEEDESKTEQLRTVLLRKSQKAPDNVAYSEMLIWYFKQKKQFAAALIHVKAHDKRSNSNGKKLLDFGELCVNNKAYSTAIKAFDAVISYGPESLFEQRARSRKLNSMYLKISETSDWTENEVRNLANLYQSELSKLEFIGGATDLIWEKAEIHGYYLRESDSSVVILEGALAKGGLSKKNRAITKLKLAEFLTISGKVWDASLYYSQVEKDFKHDPLGHQAKFQNAKLSYYNGDFEWAQAQLDVLKASTSKLISNDAIELSVLISDNIWMDSTNAALIAFSKADLLVRQNKFEEANQVFDSLSTSIGFHALNDEILFKRYEMEFIQKNYSKAIEYLEAIIKDYADDILADNAHFKLAEMYELRLNQPGLATVHYREILFNYTGSLLVIEARKRFRRILKTLPEEQIEKLELNSGRGIKKIDPN